MGREEEGDKRGERDDARGAKGDRSDRNIGRENGRGRREETRRTEEKGDGGMGEGSAARNYWAVGSGGSMW
jgi:hypothetical protein